VQVAAFLKGYFCLNRRTAREWEGLPAQKHSTHFPGSSSPISRISFAFFRVFRGQKPFARILSGRKKFAMVVCMITVSIALRSEDQDFIQEAVTSGRFFSESEVVAEALSGLKVREAIRRGHMEELRNQLRIGTEQADRGEFVEFTAADVMAEGRKRLAAQQNSL
jgi:antitoxin ParD1/3/4